jgi:hypothetical protein
MDWDQSVNADDEIETLDEMTNFTSPVRTNSSEARPCLYLGAAGQRCDRAATQGGFCPRHQRGETGLGAPLVPSRLVAVLLVILALLWPVLADVVRELIRLIH